MAIQANEILFYKPATISDAASNGGRMSANAIPGGVKNNVFPDIPQGERDAGSTRYRKTFIKVANDDDIILANPRVFVETLTPGDDRLLIFPGTQTDAQGDLTGSERLYGAGSLDADVSAGASTVDVNVEAAADAVFQNGDLVRISDKTSVSDASGSVEFIRLDATAGVSWNGDKATLTFESGATLQNAYLAADTRVAACIEPADVAASWDNWGGSTSAGTYDGTAPGTPPTVNVPILDWIGSVEETWTVTFTDASNFTCVGDSVGSVGGGDITTDFSPNNSDFSKPYFTLPFAGWGGTWAAGEILTFKTHPAATPVWWKRIVPAGADSLSSDLAVVAISGESA